MSEEFTIFGRLAIYVVRDPVSWHGKISNNEQYLGDFTGPQWESLFYKVLGCPIPNFGIPNEDVDEANNHYRIKFQNHLRQYPMLGRIWDIYEGVNYLPKEVCRFRDECLEVRASTANPCALDGLNILIQACDKAKELGYGLVFESD